MIKIISRLPMWALYAFSSFLYLLAFYVVRHRHQVISEQLEKVFPNSSAAERKEIHKQFLRSFCDVLVELLKSVSMTEADMRRRMLKCLSFQCAAAQLTLQGTPPNRPYRRGYRKLDRP